MLDDEPALRFEHVAARRNDAPRCGLAHLDRERDARLAADQVRADVRARCNAVIDDDHERHLVARGANAVDFVRSGCARNDNTGKCEHRQAERSATSARASASRAGYRTGDERERISEARKESSGVRRERQHDKRHVAPRVQSHALRGVIILF